MISDMINTDHYCHQGQEVHRHSHYHFHIHILFCVSCFDLGIKALLWVEIKDEFNQKNIPYFIEYTTHSLVKRMCDQELGHATHVKVCHSAELILYGAGNITHSKHHFNLHNFTFLLHPQTKLQYLLTCELLCMSH
jgi:hypothetical protein